jgi:exonuclease III
VKLYHHDPGGRYSRVDCLWEGELFTILCIYAPANHTQRKSFFADTLCPYVQRHPPSDKCFIGGDFNFVDSPTLDRSRVSASCIAGLIEWSEIAESLNLFDTFRNFHSKTKSFTYRCPSSSTQTRIDRVYSSHAAIPYAKSCKHVPLVSVISDHQAGVEVTVRAINASTRGPSFWKLNSSFLQRPGFQKIVKKTISDFISSKHLYPSLQSW